MDDERCGTCRFWGWGVPIGECLRYAPRPWVAREADVKEEEWGTFWPPVLEDGWCGEYRRTPLPVGEGGAP